MSCRYYESSPGCYGSCSAKRESARRESGRGYQSESDGYIEWSEWRAYDCNSGSCNYQNCPYYSSSSSSTSCYITTACVMARGLPDDCDELNTLRAFRDTWLKKRPHGSEDIQRYYQTAPAIVAAMEHQPNAKELFSDLYETLVCPCVEYIKQGAYEEAYTLYQNTTLRLMEEYIGSSI